MAFSRLTFSVWSPIFAIRASASRFLSCSSASWEASLAFRSPTWRKSHYVQVTCVGNDKYQIQLIFLNEFTDPYQPASFISSSSVPTLVPCAKNSPASPPQRNKQHSVFWLLSEKCNLCQHQLEIYLLPSVCAVRETSTAVPTCVHVTQAPVTRAPSFSGPVKLRLKAAEATGRLAWWQAGGTMVCALQRNTMKGSEKLRHRYSLAVMSYYQFHWIRYSLWWKCLQTGLFSFHRIGNGPLSFFHLIQHST